MPPFLGTWRDHLSAICSDPDLTESWIAQWNRNEFIQKNGVTSWVPLQEAKAISNKKVHNDLSGFSWFLPRASTHRSEFSDLVVPSGKRLHSYWKWPSRNSGFTQLQNGVFPWWCKRLPEGNFLVVFEESTTWGLKTSKHHSNCSSYFSWFISHIYIYTYMCTYIYIYMGKL